MDRRQHRSPSMEAQVVRNPLLDTATNLSDEATQVRRGSIDPDDLVGHLVADRYRLLSIIGRGGMGYVYLAEQEEIGKRLAIKVLAIELAQNPEYRERFLREAKAASKIAHENVITVTDFGEAPNGSVFIAMELLGGENLADTVARDAPFSVVRTKKIILQICRALHAAHSNGVLHRDVKPENCYRIKRGSNRDVIKVLDFGIAKVTGNENDPVKSITQSGTVFGTPEYMSPEQARGLAVDARSDIYSTGIVLFELATGHVPFEGESHVAVMTAQTSDPPPSPSQLAPDPSKVPAQLEAVILRALQKDPEDRYATIREFAEALAAVPDESSDRQPRVDSSREQLYLKIIVGQGLAVATLLVVVLALLLT